MTGAATEREVYYDPYDFTIDADPYPTFKRLRDEAPLYYNEAHDFYAVNRFEDVRECSGDWQTYSSARGTLLELIKANMEMPKGIFIFEDPPEHDVHRSVLSRVFTPKRMGQIEPQVREFCARTLDPLVGASGFDFIADLAAFMPMRVIGMLLGIPEQDQQTIKQRIDDGLKIEEGQTPSALETEYAASMNNDFFADYIDWRAEHPSDDLMTDLLNAEFTDTDGKVRKLTREEVLNYVTLLAAAGNETTTRLIGWGGKVLAEFPDQRALLVENPGLMRDAIEELLRFESPSPVQGRYVTRDVEHHGRKVPEGSVILLLTAAANRDERKFPDPDRFDVQRKIDQHLGLGWGVHFCLGAHLARLEGRVALEEVLKRFPEWDVDYDNAVQAHTSTVRGWEKLPVVIP